MLTGIPHKSVLKKKSHHLLKQPFHDMAAGDTSLSLPGLLGRLNGHNWLEVIQPNQVFMYEGTFSLHQLMCTETNSEKPRSNGIISL